MFKPNLNGEKKGNSTKMEFDILTENLLASSTKINTCHT